MSRTFRTIRRVKKVSDGWEVEITTGDESKASYYNAGWYGNRKMRPYTKQRSPIKYEVPHTLEYLRKKTFDYKEGIRNANRSMKKAFRQQLKKELRNELENL